MEEAVLLLDKLSWRREKALHGSWGGERGYIFNKEIVQWCPFCVMSLFHLAVQELLGASV